LKIFITGATGFIGTHLTKLLVETGHEVTALLRTEAKKKNLPSKVEVIKGDLSLFEDENLKLPAFDVVIHLAGVIFEKNKAGYYKYNFHAVEHIVNCLKRQDWKLKRFVFASSLAAAGPSNPDVPMLETDIPNPVDHYGGAKLASEKFLETVAEFAHTSFRPAIVLGPGDENSLTLFKMAKGHLGVNIDGKPQYMSFVDVDDLNDGILKMVEDDTNANRKFFVSHPDRASNVLIFKTLEKVMNTKVFLIPLPKFVLFGAMKASTLVSSVFGIKNQLDEKQYNQLLNHFVCSGKALTTQLGWSPKHNLESSAKKAYEGYKAQGWI